MLLCILICKPCCTAERRISDTQAVLSCAALHAEALLKGSLGMLQVERPLLKGRLGITA